MKGPISLAVTEGTKKQDFFMLFARKTINVLRDFPVEIIFYEKKIQVQYFFFFFKFKDMCHDLIGA